MYVALERSRFQIVVAVSVCFPAFTSIRLLVSSFMYKFRSMALYVVFIDALLKSHVMTIDNCLIRIQAILYGHKKCVVIIHKKTSIHSF